MAAGIFDLNTPLEFFVSLKNILGRYNSRQAKDIEDLLYVIMGLNHLSEWIAPGYDRKKSPKNAQEAFSYDISKTTSHETIRLLCNHTKHLTKKIKTSTQYGLPIDDWTDFDAVRDIDLGQASNYFIEGKNIIEIIDEVIIFYETNWFNLLTKTP